ncbi:hypothetical protein LTR95_008884 [Oleoguttula sp. CCFEE 5521]
MAPSNTLHISCSSDDLLVHSAAGASNTPERSSTPASEPAMQSEQDHTAIATPLDPTTGLRRSCSTDELAIPSSARHETISPPADTAATPASEVRVTELSDQTALLRSSIENLQITVTDLSRRVAALEAPAPVPRLELAISITTTPDFDAFSAEPEEALERRREAARVTGWAPAPDFRGRFNANSREVPGVVRSTSSADETDGARNVGTRPVIHGLYEYR